MSGEDDTFDIDLYGDDEKKSQDQQALHDDPDENLIFDDDDEYDNVKAQESGASGKTSMPQVKQESSAPDPISASPKQENPAPDTTSAPPQQENPSPDSTSSPPQQGKKRKAQDDLEAQGDLARSKIPQAINPNATPALKISELHWWTTEDDLRKFCAAADSEAELREISFGEHKINGKSRGEVYLEFSSPAAAEKVKAEIEKKEGEEAKRINSFQVYYAMGNPWKGRDSGALGRKEHVPQAALGRGGGAYNQNFANNRGGFANRGAGGFNRGGGGFNRGGGFQQQQQQQQQQGWNNGMGMGPGGLSMNHAMARSMLAAGIGVMGTGFNGMNNMARGGFGGMGNMGGMGMGMGNMSNMGMGNMGNMGMGNMGNMGMGGRGGMMGGRGGYGGGGGGGFQQGGMGQGFGGTGAGAGASPSGYGLGGQANKRMKNE